MYVQMYNIVALPFQNYFCICFPCKYIYVKLFTKLCDQFHKGFSVRNAICYLVTLEVKLYVYTFSS